MRGEGQDHEDTTGHDLLRRVRFQLRHIGQWKFTPPRASESGQWLAQREAMVLTGALLHDLLDELETWELPALDEPVTAVEISPTQLPAELPQRVPRPRNEP